MDHARSRLSQISFYLSRSTYHTPSSGLSPNLVGGAEYLESHTMAFKRHESARYIVKFCHEIVL